MRKKPYAAPVERFTRVVERHERAIARHTAIQSWIGALQLLIGAATTLALLYITQQQYKASERQVALEYAKVAPSFEVQTTYFPGKSYFIPDQYFPRTIKIRIKRGEAEVTRVEAIQDFEISVIPRPRKKHINCVVRTSNFFSAANGPTDLTAREDFSPIALDPVRDLSGGRGTILISSSTTWVKVFFQDLFGEERALLYSISNQAVDKVPSNELGGPAIYELVDAKVKSRLGGFPRIFREPKTRPTGAECRYILEDLQKA